LSKDGSKYGQSLDDMAEYLNVLYYGDPGSGKTSAAAAMAHLGDVYLLDVESGAKSKPLRKLGIPTQRIRPVAVSCYQDVDDFYWYLKQELEDGAPIAGVVFDSMTEIHDQLIGKQVEIRHAKAVRKVTARDGTLLQEVDDNEFLVELPERGIVTEQLRRITRRFRDLPCHTAFTALSKREVDPNGEGVAYLPQLPPKFGTQLRGFVDVVGYMSKAPAVENASGYLGVFRDTGLHKGKDRLGALPPVMADPAFHRVSSVIFEDLDLSTDASQNEYLGRVRAARPEPEPFEQGPDGPEPEPFDK
jgi:hypothetical protein